MQISRPMGPTELTRTAVIADDHAMVRQGLRDLLEGLPMLAVVGEAGNGIEATAAGEVHRPTLMTLDAGMPLSNGMGVFGEVRRWSPDTRILLVTGFTSAGLLADWIAAGIEGLLLKSSDPDTMRLGMQTVLDGGGFIDPVARAVIERDDARDALTLRERQVLHLITEGHGNGEIARRLLISPKTVENHRTRMMAKLDVHSVAQLVAYALREGLLDRAAQTSLGGARMARGRPRSLTMP